LVERGLAPLEDSKARNLTGDMGAMEFEIVTTLKAMGHDVLVLEVEDDLRSIHKFVDKWCPHVAFNLMESFDGISIFDQNVVSYLELLQVPYTGCNPRGLVVARNKALAKKVLLCDNIPTPKFEVFPKNQPIKKPKHLDFPLIVKSLTEESSTGIAQSSIVYDEEKLVERIRFIHENVRTDAIVESYIEGRELYVGVIGNQRIEAFPVWELDLKGVPDAVEKIATAKIKFDEKYRKRYGINSAEVKNLSPAKINEIQEICKRVYRSLNLNGYARMDLRLTPSGEVYVIEANPNPHLGKDEDFAKSARRAGHRYEDLLNRILALGMRWQPEDQALAA